jgi:hypothetical protein
MAKSVQTKKAKKKSPKKVAPKKASPKKASPKKVAPKKVAPKKVVPKKERGCSRQETSKYANRPSPPYPASCNTFQKQTKTVRANGFEYKIYI